MLNFKELFQKVNIAYNHQLKYRKLIKEKSFKKKD